MNILTVRQDSIHLNWSWELALSLRLLATRNLFVMSVQVLFEFLLSHTIAAVQIWFGSERFVRNWHIGIV